MNDEEKLVLIRYILDNEKSGVTKSETLEAILNIGKIPEDPEMLSRFVQEIVTGGSV